MDVFLLGVAQSLAACLIIVVSKYLFKVFKNKSPCNSYKELHLETKTHSILSVVFIQLGIFFTIASVQFTLKDTLFYVFATLSLVCYIVGFRSLKFLSVVAKLCTKNLSEHFDENKPS
ncbi:MAG: hypothetical protein ACYCX2_00510 [Christensenellales bacterium]